MIVLHNVDDCSHSQQCGKESTFKMRIVSQNTHHMGIGSLPTAPRLLNLLLLNLRSRLDDFVFARRRDPSLVQLLLDSLLIRNLDLLPDRTELVIERLVQRGIIDPNHLGMIVLLIPSDQ